LETPTFFPYQITSPQGLQQEQVLGSDGKAQAQSLWLEDEVTGHMKYGIYRQVENRIPHHLKSAFPYVVTWTSSVRLFSLAAAAQPSLKSAQLATTAASSVG